MTEIAFKGKDKSQKYDNFELEVRRFHAHGLCDMKQFMCYLHLLCAQNQGCREVPSCNMTKCCLGSFGLLYAEFSVYFGLLSIQQPFPVVVFCRPSLVTICYVGS